MNIQPRLNWIELNNVQKQSRRNSNWRRKPFLLQESWQHRFFTLPTTRQADKIRLVIWKTENSSLKNVNSWIRIGLIDFKMRDVAKYLNSQQNTVDQDLAAEWAKLESLYNKKLWHQLTIEMLDFVKHPSLQSNNELVQLYENFVADFENK